MSFSLRNLSSLHHLQICQTPSSKMVPVSSIIVFSMPCAWTFICVISGLVFESFVWTHGGAHHRVPGDRLALGCIEWIGASECQATRLPIRMSGLLSVLSLPHLTLNNSSLGMETNQGLKTTWSLWMGFRGLWAPGCYVYSYGVNRCVAFNRFSKGVMNPQNDKNCQPRWWSRSLEHSVASAPSPTPCLSSESVEK